MRNSSYHLVPAETHDPFALMKVAEVRVAWGSCYGFVGDRLGNYRGSEVSFNDGGRHAERSFIVGVGPFATIGRGGVF